MILRGPK